MIFNNNNYYIHMSSEALSEFVCPTVCEPAHDCMLYQVFFVFLFFSGVKCLGRETIAILAIYSGSLLTRNSRD